MNPHSSADELADVRRALRRAPVTVDDASLTRCAVAAILSPGRRLWLIRRAERLGDPWSGHLGFPGGREHREDPDLLAVAARETLEEVGVDIGRGELLGQLDDLRTRPIRTMMIRPFVFRVEREPAFVPNHEVAGFHSITLDALLRGRGRTTMRWPPLVGVTLPCVELDGQRLWGLTLAMVDDLLHRIDGRGTGLERPVEA